MDERIEYCIDAELHFARQKFPGNKHMLAALTEEVGELAKALIDHDRGKATSAEVFAEAIQVAVMAIRIAQEGSEEHTYEFHHSDYQDFDVQKEIDFISNKEIKQTLPLNFSPVNSDVVVDEIVENIRSRKNKQDEI